MLPKTPKPLDSNVKIDLFNYNLLTLSFDHFHHHHF